MVIGITFSHATHVGKEKLACVSCHKAPGKDVTEFPEHASCLNCHRQQFFARERPVPKICSNCHVKATPLDTSRLPFPGPGKKGFHLSFSHEKHADVDCADCHQTKEPQERPRSLKHATCFACHNQESELAPLPSNCDTCHKLDGIQRAHAMLAQQPATDYSQFKHDNQNHARLPCLLCHRRENNSPQPTLPGKAAHTPCTGCHAQQFANPASAICTICHTDAQSGKVKAFPPLRSFDATFDHAKHNSVACATCHRRNRGGVGLSIPSRLNAHVTCFSCHTQNTSCSTCHQPGRLVRTPEQARAFRVGFSHARHELGCAACHQVRGRQVSAPLPLNHHAPARAFSCASCHNGQRTFGGDDFSVCTRCHGGPSWRF